MNSATFYSCLFLVQAPVWSLFLVSSLLLLEWPEAACLAFGSWLLSTLRLAVQLSHARYGSHSFILIFCLIASHIVLLGPGISSLISVIASLLVFCNSSLFTLPWSEWTSPSLRSLGQSGLPEAVIVASLTTLLPTLSISAFLMSLSLELQSLLISKFLLIRFARASLGDPSMPVCLPAPYSSLPAKLGRGSPLGDWLKLYLSGIAAGEAAGHVPVLAKDTPADLKILCARINFKEIPAHVELLLTLTESGGLVGVAAGRELKNLKNRIGEGKMIDGAVDP